jgi:hypothetical protein
LWIMYPVGNNLALKISKENWLLNIGISTMSQPEISWRYKIRDKQDWIIKFFMRAFIRNLKNLCEIIFLNRNNNLESLIVNLGKKEIRKKFRESSNSVYGFFLEF